MEKSKSQMAEILSQEEILRYLELVDRRLYIIMHSGVDWKPEYAQKLEEIDAELAELRKHVDAATDAQPASKVVANAYCGSCQSGNQECLSVLPAPEDVIAHLERLDCDPDCDLDRRQLMDEVRQAHLNGGRTPYLYDIDGNEYYTTRDGVRHYTRVEG